MEKWCGAIIIVLFFSIIQDSRGFANEEKLFEGLKVNEDSDSGTFRISHSKTNETTDTMLVNEATIKKLELQHQRASSQSKRVLTYKSTSVNIDIQLSVYPATSTSVSIAWNATINRFYVNHHSQENFENIGLKIVYRPFGSVLESEIILLMETDHSQASFNFFSEYSIENLLSSNGYIFCFSIALQKNDSEIIQNGENEKLVSDEPKPFLNRPFSRFDQENIEDHIFFPSKEFTFGYVPTLHEHRLPPSPVPNIKQPINPLVSSLLQKPSESSTSRKQNVAYSSTGELIYLPSSSWSPFSRRRRTLNYLKGNLLQDRLKNENDTYCVEIFTKAETGGGLTQIGFLIIAITIFGIAMFIIVTIVILFKILQCCKLHSDAKNESESIVVRPEVENGSDNISSVTGNSDEVIEKLQSEIKTEEKDNGISQVLENCINSSNQFVKPSYASSECTHNSSKLSTSTDEEFHPGYEIPPSSMVEVYGYDFPRPLSKYSSHPVSPAPSSCELNGQVTDFNWDKYNLDILGKENSKKINYSDSNEKFKKEVNKFETYHPSTNFSSNEKERNGLRKKSRPPTYEAFRKSEECSSHVDDDFRFNEESVNPKISNKCGYHSNPVQSNAGSHDIFCKKRSIGDIIVTGGTLIEVPEGYARPATPKAADSESSILRIVIS